MPIVNTPAQSHAQIPSQGRKTRKRNKGMDMEYELKHVTFYKDTCLCPKSQGIYFKEFHKTDKGL